MTRPYKRTMTGFSLIEVMAVVAIIGILAAVAWHFFQQEAIKNRRTQAITALTRIANELQDCHADTMTYVNCPISAAVTNSLTYYSQPVISNVSPSTYTVTLTPTGTQTDDVDCTTLTLDEKGVKGFTGSANSSVARCWGSTN